jgi:hypothetical protein
MAMGYVLDGREIRVPFLAGGKRFFLLSLVSRLALFPPCLLSSGGTGGFFLRGRMAGA